MLNIRLMNLDDIEQVAAIDRLSFSLPWPENSFRFELLENKNSRSWVAEMVESFNPTRLVGAAVVWMIVDEAHIATFAVHPEYRRMGIGQRLLSVVLMDAIQKGMITATLEVRAGNIPAQELYKKFGFQVTGDRPRYYKDNQEDALIMTVNLRQVPGELLISRQAAPVDEEAGHESR